MKKTIFLLLLVSILVSMIGCKLKTCDTNVTPGVMSTYLFFGLDDAAENTDVLFFLSYHTTQNRLSLVQIPRDTYYHFGGTQNKINQLFGFYRKNEDRDDAIAHAAKSISEVFAVPIDGYVAMTTEGMRAVIDGLGGVDIVIPEDRTFYDENGENPLFLKQGTHRLNGRESEYFVRYRQGYAMGDLGRLDAQKIFLSGFLSTVVNRLGADEILRLLPKLDGNIITDQNLLAAVRSGLSMMANLRSASVSYVTMPGEAAESERGLSYYIVNRRAAMDVLSKYLLCNRESFDSECRLTDPENLPFDHIYHDKNMGYREYTDDTLGGLHIPGKAKNS